MLCRVAKYLHCVSPVCKTHCDRLWFTHTMPCPCRASTTPLCKRLLKATAWARHGIRELTSAVPRRSLSDLSFGFFWLQRGISRKLFFTFTGWFRIGNIKRMGFQRFSQNWTFKELVYLSTYVNYFKSNPIGLQKMFFIVKKKGPTLMRRLYFSMFAISSFTAVRKLHQWIKFYRCYLPLFCCGLW